MTTDEKLKNVVNKWFLSEPLFFGVYCTHKVRVNNDLEIPFRTGKGYIEYNSNIINTLDIKDVEEYLKIECLRIILKHPYQRVPMNPIRVVLSLSSDITIMSVHQTSIKLTTAEQFNLPKNLCYEEYYAKLKNLFVEDINNTLSSDNSENDVDSEDELDIINNKIRQINESLSEKYNNIKKQEQTSALWAEDDEMSSKINSEIEKAQISNNWGSIGLELKQVIEASLVIKMNYKDMFRHFRTSIMTSSTHQTRQKPNRRYGFDFPGRTRNFTTKLLVAVDTSGSISNQSLQQFFSIINRFFKYGVEQIDVIQFDACIKDEILTLKKAKKTIQITGRGGTDVQPVIDYYESHQYDGLIVFTDGYFKRPELNRWSAKILWVFPSNRECDEFTEQMLDYLPGSRATYIPM